MSLGADDEHRLSPSVRCSRMPKPWISIHPCPLNAALQLHRPFRPHLASAHSSASPPVLLLPYRRPSVDLSLRIPRHHRLHHQSNVLYLLSPDLQMSVLNPRACCLAANRPVWQIAEVKLTNALPRYQPLRSMTECPHAPHTRS